MQTARTISQSHESLASFRKVSASSNRRFGVTVGLILAALALVPMVHHHGPRFWLLGLGLVLAVLGLAAPAVLGPLNKAWFRLGLLLASITNPIAMGAMFYGAVVPFGWYLRWRGRDLLRLRRDADLPTYWLARDAAAPVSKRQF